MMSQMEVKLEELIGREKAIPAAGVTAAQTQQLITELHTLDSIAEVHHPYKHMRTHTHSGRGRERV